MFYLPNTLNLGRKDIIFTHRYSDIALCLPIMLQVSINDKCGRIKKGSVAY